MFEILSQPSADLIIFLEGTDNVSLDTIASFVRLPQCTIDQDRRVLCLPVLHGM